MAGTWSATSSTALVRSANLPGIQSYTICGWCKATPTNFRIILSFNDGATGDLAYVDWTGTTLELSRLQAGGSHAAFTTSPTSSQWFFIGLSDDGANLRGRLFIPGVDTVFQNKTLATCTFTPTQIMIGNDPGNDVLIGTWGFIKVYDVALSDLELYREMWSTRPLRTANLNVWSPNFVGPTDYSGNGRDWTVNGSITWGAHGPPVPWGAIPLDGGTPANPMPLITWAPAMSVVGGAADTALPSGSS